MKKIDFRNLSKEAQAEIRRRAVYEYLSAGRRGKLKIAERYHVSSNTFQKWVENYDTHGERSFAIDKRGAKPYQNCALTKRQMNWLEKQLITKTPEQFDFPFMLWTRKLVTDLISRKFGIRVDESTAGEYLRRFGMTPQKPILKSYKQQTDAVKSWINTEYPLLACRANAESALIFWGDETAIRSRDQVGKGYSKRGVKPIESQAGYRFGVNMVSAVNNSGNSRFMLFSGRMNSARFIEFLGRLLKNQSQKIILILDNAAWHKSAAVKAYAAEHVDKLELVYLPTYAPELNPDEYLNNALKQKLNHRPKAKSPSELTSAAASIMKSMQSRRIPIKNIFKHDKVKYAA